MGFEWWKRWLSALLWCFSGPCRLRPWEQRLQRNRHNRPCLRAYVQAWETFPLCGLSEGQGLHGHHTSHSLMVSRTRSPRHPAVQPAGSAGASHWANPARGLRRWADSPRGDNAPMLRQAFVLECMSVCVRACISLSMCACVRKRWSMHLKSMCMHVSVCIPVYSYLFACVWVGGRQIPPDAFSPRTPSGVPANPAGPPQREHTSRPRGRPSPPNDTMHQSSSQPGLTCPSVLFMVAYPCWKNAYGRGALWSPVGNCVHSQQWRAFKDRLELLVSFTLFGRRWWSILKCLLSSLLCS